MKRLQPMKAWPDRGRQHRCPRCRAKLTDAQLFAFYFVHRCWYCAENEDLSEYVRPQSEVAL